jgi:CDP-paratose 2-epimerase
MNKILVTGGCGFVGSNLAINFKKQFPSSSVVCLDNLKKRGSEASIVRLKSYEIDFIHGDIRNPEDINGINTDLIIECSADASVLSSYGSGSKYLLHSNLYGTVNCLELAKNNQAKVVFLSTSRVYPFKRLNNLKLVEEDTRFSYLNKNRNTGVGENGINEFFPLDGPKSLYGASKYASEIIIQEYVDMHNLDIYINRCGVLGGPWQFGTSEQGFIALWVASHYYKKSLKYIGFGGSGKQVRDILHVDDLYHLILSQVTENIIYPGVPYNIGGGLNGSISLLELTKICEKVTGNKILIDSVIKNRKADIPWYVSDCSKILNSCDWMPKKNPTDIVSDVFEWINNNDKLCKRFFV